MENKDKQNLIDEIEKLREQDLMVLSDEATYHINDVKVAHLVNSLIQNVINIINDYDTKETN
jgi:hypothetical protein